MLQAIRTKAGSIIVKVLFVLLIVSFGFWGIYTRSPYFQSKSPDTEIATVGDATIRLEDLQGVLEPALERLRAQLGASIDRQQVKQLGILDNVLSELIDRSLIDQEVRYLKLDVSDEVIRNAIAGNPAFHDAAGQFDRDRFNQVLALNHLSEGQFIARMRTDIPRSDILLAATTGVTVPGEVINVLFGYRNETRIADIVALPIGGAADPGLPGEPDLAKFYDAHQDLFRAPEYRGFTLASLSSADLAAGIEIPEDKLKAEYEQRKDDFATPEERDVQQILAPTEDKAKAAETALAAGKDWQEVATTIAGQSAETIDLGLLKRSEMPGELAEVAFSLDLNKPSDPIKTPLGWHILRIVKIVPPSTETYEEAKGALAAILAKEQALEQLDKIANQADDALAGGSALAEVATKFGLKTTVVDAADVGGRGPDGKPVALPIGAPEVLKVAFATEQGEISRIVAVQDAAIFAVHTDKVIAPRVKPLDEVKDAAVAAWQQQQKHDAVLKEAAALAAAVSPTTSLKALAADRKLTVTTSPPLSRRNRHDTNVSPALVAKLFSAKQGEAVSAEDASGAYVAQLNEIMDPGAPSLALAAQLSDELTQASRLDVAAQFTAALRNRFPVKIDREALDRSF